MVTDTPPRKTNGAGFLESDRITTLDLPRDGRLPTITKSIDSAMKSDKSADVRRACAEFLTIASEFYEVPACGVRVLAARPLRVRERWTTELFGGLQSRNHADPGLDADGGAQESHVIRHVREHSLPRVLPSSRFSEVRIPRLMAHSRVLRASRCALPSCTGNAAEATVLVARERWTLAN